MSRAMKQGALIFVFVIFAACGGDDDGGGGGDRADARPLADGGGGGNDDGGSDPDGGGGDGSPLIWALGDFATDNVTKLVVFAPDAALPVTPLAVFPAGDVAEIWGESGNADYGPFDVSPDGTRVAFSADIDMAGRFDLYVAPVEGGEAVHVVAVGAEADVEKVRFSPDGTRIAFAADLDTDGQLDAYVVAADAALGTPVRVSPPRASADDDLDARDLVWSTDSTQLVMTGDFTDQDFFEMWIADVTVADPEPTAVIDRARIETDGFGAKGAIFPLLVDGDRILFRGRLDDDGELDRVKIVLIGTNGQNEGLLGNSQITRGDDSIADVGTVTLSPDGTQIAFTADEVPTIYDVWVMPADGSMAPTKLTTGLENEDTNPIHTQPLKWRQDGQSIAFLADYGEDGKTEPYVLPVTGGGQVRLADFGNAAEEQDANSIAWSPAGDVLFMAADVVVNNDTELFRLDPAMADQEPALAIDAPPGGDMNSVRASD
jgi:Tol biopolymer transport system component